MWDSVSSRWRLLLGDPLRTARALLWVPVILILLLRMQAGLRAITLAPSTLLDILFLLALIDHNVKSVGVVGITTLSRSLVSTHLCFSSVGHLLHGFSSAGYLTSTSVSHMTKHISGTA